jgi:hypothetical protein
MKKLLVLSLVIMICLIVLPASVAFAQEPGLTLKLTKQVGYNGFDGKIQGAFLLQASDPADLRQVSFFIDGTLMGVDDQAPFEVQFSTGSYPLGVHTYTAEGRLSSGQLLQAQPIRAESIGGAEARKAAIKIALPIVLLSFGTAALSAIIPLLGMRKGATRSAGSYSPASGAICPRCTMPFSRHVFSLNLLAGKLERCPHCGKWSVVRRASPAVLAAAEERLHADDQSAPVDTEDERAARLRKVIDDSRFEE